MGQLSLRAHGIGPGSLTLAAAALIALSLTGFFNYLLFHSLCEIIAVAVAVAIFLFVWSARSFMEDHGLLFLGIAYLFVAILDLLHTLLYHGMNVFPATGFDEPTQMWVAARLLESASLAAVPLLIGRRIRLWIVITLYSVLVAAAVATILLWPVFPSCCIDGVSVTAFKKTAELVVVLLLAACLVLLRASDRHFAEPHWRLFAAAVVIKIAAELLFMSYAELSPSLNMIGHLLKLISFWLIYSAVVRTGLVRPFDLLFRNLKLREREREQLINDLRDALGEVKTLSGMLPICARCKQIRDDRGYWHQVEEYIRTHTDTEFTHSYCPDCARELLDSID